MQIRDSPDSMANTTYNIKRNWPHEQAMDERIEKLRMTHPEVAGLAVSLAKTISVGKAIGISETKLAEMTRSAADAYDRYFSNLNADESIRLLEKVGHEIGGYRASGGDSDSKSIASSFLEFDKDRQSISINRRPSVKTLDVLTAICSYAKGSAFSFRDGIVNAPAGDSDYHSAREFGPWASGSKFELDKRDCNVIVGLSRSMPLLPSIPVKVYASAITDAAMLFNEFIRDAGPDGSQFLEYLIGMPYIKDLYPLDKGNRIESKVLSLLENKMRFNDMAGNATAVELHLNDAIMKHSSDWISLRVFMMALNIMAKDSNGSDMHIAISDSGRLYAKGSIYKEMESFMRKTEHMKFALGPAYSIVEEAAMSSIDIFLSGPSKHGSNEAKNMIDTLRKGIFFGWLGSTNEEVKSSVDGNMMKMIEALKGAAPRTDSAFVLMADAISLVYGLDIHVEKVGGMVSLKSARPPRRKR